MMQEARFGIASRVPKFGASLELLRKWEQLFRAESEVRGFTEVNLPLCWPLERFRSRQTGDVILSPGPRFTDTQGIEWALRSDMTAFTTQFVLEHAAEIEIPARLSYAGKVFSYLTASSPCATSASHSLSTPEAALELYEYGAEIIGSGELEADLEVTELAMSVANRFGYEKLTVVVGDVRIGQALTQWLLENAPKDERVSMLERLRDALATNDLKELHDLVGPEHIRAIFKTSVETSRANEFVAAIQARPLTNVDIRFDPWLLRPQNFYSGLVFEIFTEDKDGNLRWIGGGGRYDNLYSHFGRELPAVGFMMRDPRGARVNTSSYEEGTTTPTSPVTRRPLRIALPKGRLSKHALEAFRAVGIDASLSPDSTRKLVIPSTDGKFEFLLVKNSDVTRYIEEGVCEIGIAGSDVLDEHPSHFLRPVTFPFGECRICLAGKPEDRTRFASLPIPRIASKYTKIARQELRRRGIACDIIPLQGSVELASVINMAHAIVDLVETGTTLKENGLEVYDTLATTRVQLAVSKGFYYQYAPLLQSWMETWAQNGLLLAPHATISGDFGL